MLKFRNRPVIANFEIEVKSIDQNKKGKIIQDYIVYFFLLFASFLFL